MYAGPFTGKWGTYQWSLHFLQKPSIASSSSSAWGRLREPLFLLWWHHDWLDLKQVLCRWPQLLWSLTSVPRAECSIAQLSFPSTSSYILLPASHRVLWALLGWGSGTELLILGLRIHSHIVTCYQNWVRSLHSLLPTTKRLCDQVWEHHKSMGINI